MGRNPRDRHARSDPKANCQKDKKGKQFPHNRLRSGWVGEPPKPTMSGCSIAGALFQGDFADCFICFRGLLQRQPHQAAEKLRSIRREVPMRRGGSVTLGQRPRANDARPPYASRAAIAVSIAWNGSWQRRGREATNLLATDLLEHHDWPKLIELRCSGWPEFAPWRIVAKQNAAWKRT
jgi:hypothetical protein